MTFRLASHPCWKLHFFLTESRAVRLKGMLGEAYAATRAQISLLSL